MGTFKGTKGEWTGRVNPMSKNKERIIESANGILIAFVKPEEVTDEECEANAKLIAFAPELLKALILIEKMNVQNAVDQYGDATKADSWSCVKVARTAIKKATE